MPNSAACLIEFVVSPPALARPMIFAFDDCACSRNELKSWLLSGTRTDPSTLGASWLFMQNGAAELTVDEWNPLGPHFKSQGWVLTDGAEAVQIDLGAAGCAGERSGFDGLGVVRQIAQGLGEVALGDDCGRLRNGVLKATVAAGQGLRAGREGQQGSALLAGKALFGVSRRFSGGRLFAMILEGQVGRP